MKQPEREKVLKWAQQLTNEQAIPLLVELIDFAHEAEFVSVYGLVPSWSHTGEPLIEGQVVSED